jgi:hypothetical protein
MLKLEMLIMDHHQRISHRENYLAVAISRRDCLMPLGVISGTDALEDLHRVAAVVAMVGAIFLDFVWVLDM